MLRLILELSKTINLHKPLFPQYEDLVGAVEGLFRLQEIYHIPAQDIVDGSLSKNYPNATMKTEDCFQVGLIAYHDKDYERAKEWMLEGLRKYQPTVYSGFLSRKILLEFIAWCEYEVSITSYAHTSKDKDRNGSSLYKTEILFQIFPRGKNCQPLNSP